jgi:biopolymer transport protein ExbD
MHIETAAKGGRRSLDAGINIVPYIDMLMTLMIFLMVTAVWTRVSSLDTASSGSNEPCANCGDPVPPVHVRITGEAFVVESSPAFDLATAIRLARHWADERAGSLAGSIGAAGTATVDVEVDDGVRLERVAAFLDAAKGAGLSTPSLRGVAR